MGFSAKLGIQLGFDMYCAVKSLKVRITWMMESQVSVTAANMVMEHVEDGACWREGSCHFCYKAYFLEEVCQWHLQQLYQKTILRVSINHSMRLSPQFNLLLKDSRTVTYHFLTFDVNGSSVYQKPMHADQYLHFSSHHPNTPLFEPSYPGLLHTLA